jgi:hydrogenase maturation protease
MENRVLIFLRSEIQHWSKTLVIGLGNRDRADDGIGLELANRLKERFPGRVLSEEDRSVEGIVLENLDRADIQTFVFVDATSFGQEPGELKWFSMEDASRFVPALSTHKVPMSLLMETISNHEKDAYLLGIQPQSLEFMGPMSSAIKKILEELEKGMILLLNENKAYFK